MKRTGEMAIGLSAATALATLAIPIGAVGADAESGSAPIRLVMSRHVGWEVDRTTRGKICVVTSGDECRSRKPSGEPGGFNYPSSVAIDSRTGNLYVADMTNYRVQELTATGAFVSMFGWDVNRTKDAQVGSAQAERNVCAATSGDLCTAGVAGTAAGQFTYVASVAVDPASGDVYVLEIDNGDSRVDKYTANGRFVWMIGKNVNETTKGSICREQEVKGSGTKCKAGAENAADSIEPAAFKFAPQYGDLLAVGGPEDLLYVGDEHRVQVFDARGRWRREILLASISATLDSSVASLALDKAGDLYVVYRTIRSESNEPVEQADLVRRFNQNREETGQFPVTPRLRNATVHIDGIALDAAGRLAVIGVEVGPSFHERFGLLYSPDMGVLLGEFAPPSDNDGLTFNGQGDLYVAATDDQEVVAYVPASAAELVSSLMPCEVGTGHDRSVAFDCALSGTVEQTQ